MGRGPGVLALGVCALNPTVLAHGKQISSDVATSFFTLAAVYGTWRLCREPSRKAFAVAALATTGALASKFTSVLLVPIVLALGIVDVLRRRPRRSAASAPSGRDRRRLDRGWWSCC